ncbi:hypothetical protein, partial [Intestinirhabdus alba]|uniref:hypothetical protein n=1 Tax=Intestinirhabdus alba TaxID=2899544 RepID=UPI00142EA10D
PRQESASALGLKVSQLGVQYRCPITALALNDEVGVVQELNNGRLQIVEATRLYIEQPAIFHRHIISESVIQYLDKIKADIAAVSQPRVGFNGPAIGGKGPKPMSKEEAAAETFAKQYARLLKSYDEPARAAFAKQFEYRLASSQERIETIDKDLAAWYQAESWLKTITYDYAPDSSAVGWDAQMKTIAGCVQGGAMSKATEDVWLVWLKKPDSPAYLGFTGMNTSLLGAVFSGANVFGNLKTAATIDEFGMYLKGKALRQGWAARILAVSASVSRLGRAVDAATRKGYLAMTQAAMLTAGESIVMVRYQTTLRKLKRKLKYDAALRQALAKNNITFEKSGIEGLRGGSAVVVDELMGIRGKALDTPVIIEQSLPGTLEEIRAKLPGINVTKAPFNNPAMLGDIEELFISDLSLQGKGTTGPVVRASYAQLAAWNERGMRLISGDSAGLIMGAGLMALQMANWTDLIDRLHTSVGTDLDVIADISISNLLFIEGFSELSGFAWKLMIKQNWVVLSKAQQVPGPVRFGAVLGGIAAIVDGFRNWIHALKSFNAGDYAAGGYYTASALAALVGGGIGAGYGFAGNFAFTSARFLGPVGWAAVLIIAGIMLAYRASELRTTAFEKWLRRTCFGLRDHNFTGVVWNADSLDDLAEAVVEYRAIRSGMVADVAFASALDIFTGNPTVQSEDYCRVDFRVSMPGWVKGSGGWSLTLTGNNRQLFSQSDSAPGLDDHYQLTGPEGYYKYQLRVDGEAGADENAEGPQTLSIMVSVWVVKNGTPEVTLVAEYWPDKAEPEYKLGLTINAKQD